MRKNLQVSQCESWAGELLLLAGADLQLESEELDDPNDPEYTPKFYGDPVKSGQWYYVHKHNAFALSAPWASKLAHKLFTGTLPINSIKNWRAYGSQKKFQQVPSC